MQHIRPWSKKDAILPEQLLLLLLPHPCQLRSPPTLERAAGQSAAAPAEHSDVQWDYGITTGAAVPGHK